MSYSDESMTASAVIHTALTRSGRPPSGSTRAVIEALRANGLVIVRAADCRGAGTSTTSGLEALHRLQAAGEIPDA